MPRSLTLTRGSHICTGRFSECPPEFRENHKSYEKKIGARLLTATGYIFNEVPSGFDNLYVI